MKLELLQPEPELEFGDGGLCHDIRFGIGHYGTYDHKKDAGREIKLGIIGNEETINSLAEWLEECRGEIAAKPSKQPNLFPLFPGFSKNHSFFSKLTWDSRSLRTINFPQNLNPNKANFNKIIKEITDLYTQEISYVLDKTDVNVVICALPIEQLKITTASYMGIEEISEMPSGKKSESNKESNVLCDFHDYLKAESIGFRVPIQLVLPATYDESKHSVQKKIINRDQQDEATRAWNLHTALYYKSRGIPWRMTRQESDLSTCYLGISFFRTLDKKSIYASSAQVFNERGEGVVVRGGIAYEDNDDRQVHLDAEGAYSLVIKALNAFWEEHFHFPARIVLHKTSIFSKNEIEGFSKGFEEKGIKNIDYVYLRQSSTRLLRTSSYPALRGTLLDFEDRRGILYTKGSVPFYETYPGKYPPRSLYIDCQQAQKTLKELAWECLSLTKMNWNSTRFDQRSPITLTASREVGQILKYVDDSKSDKIPSSYRFYM